MFLATVTHFEPYASGPVAFVGSSLAAGCSGLLGCFCGHLHTLSPVPVALSPSLAAGCCSLLGCFWRQIHTLGPLPGALSPSLGLRRWLLVYPPGLIFVFGVNCLRILGLFLLIDLVGFRLSFGQAPVQCNPCTVSSTACSTRGPFTPRKKAHQDTSSSS